MTLPLEDLERGVVEVLRAHPGFAGWRKPKKRVLQETLGDLQRGVEFIRYKHAWEENQTIGIGVYASFPAEEPRSYYNQWIKGRLYRRAYLVPGVGMVDENTIGSGSVVDLRNHDDLDTFLQQLRGDLGDHVEPWLRQFNTVEDAWYELKIPQWRLDELDALGR